MQSTVVPTAVDDPAGPRTRAKDSAVNAMPGAGTAGIVPVVKGVPVIAMTIAGLVVPKVVSVTEDENSCRNITCGVATGERVWHQVWANCFAFGVNPGVTPRAITELVTAYAWVAVWATTALAVGSDVNTLTLLSEATTTGDELADVANPLGLPLDTVTFSGLPTVTFRGDDAIVTLIGVPGIATSVMFKGVGPARVTFCGEPTVVTLSGEAAIVTFSGVAGRLVTKALTFCTDPVDATP